MHPDIHKLAAYLDDALAPGERAALRAHVLTCADCAARLTRLRADAGRISAALAAAPVPDVRDAMRARLRRRAPFAGVWRATVLAGALAAVFLFALLLSTTRGFTIGRVPDVLYVTDRAGGRILALDADSGAVVNQAVLGDGAGSIVYDSARNRLYVVLKQAIVAVDPRTLGIVWRWDAPQAFGSARGLVFDERSGRFYALQPDGVVELDINDERPVIAQTFAIGAGIVELALAPSGSTLYALDEVRARMWTIDLATGRATAQTLAQPAGTRYGWVVAGQDGNHVFVLLTRAGRGDQVQLWRLDQGGASETPATLSNTFPPWDMQLLDTGQLAIPRGDGVRGGIELVDAATLQTTARLDPERDEHHIAVGPNGSVFGLNFTHNTVTRFDTRVQRVVWRTPPTTDWQPWEAVFVPGGWRW